MNTDYQIPPKEKIKNHAAFKQKLATIGSTNVVKQGAWQNMIADSWIAAIKQYTVYNGYDRQFILELWQIVCMNCDTNDCYQCAGNQLVNSEST